MPNPISKKLLLGLVVLLVVGFAATRVWANENNKTPAKADAAKTASNSSGASAQPAAKYNPCTSNTNSKAVVVSISKQHLWGCESAKNVYDNPVITGMEKYPADLTPTGTYQISGKLTDQTLAGSDSTGHWSDFVNYWMPFLYNQYGTYGFHDLTQTANGANGRADSDFGNIDINAPYTAAKHASHGCVEMPLAAMKWLYSWAAIGTTVTIES